MNKATCTLLALLLNSTVSLFTTPAAAQSGGCTGDYVCSEPGVVATWPLDRWTTIRRASRPTATAK